MPNSEWIRVWTDALRCVKHVGFGDSESMIRKIRGGKVLATAERV